MIVYRMSLFEYFQTSFAATTRNPERSFGRGDMIFFSFTIKLLPAKILLLVFLVQCENQQKS